MPPLLPPFEVAMSARDAQRYERLFPGTGLPEAQKEERMQREDFKAERAELRRTGRNRGVVFNIDNPWLNSLTPRSPR